jgi:hypothetical protein
MPLIREEISIEMLTAVLIINISIALFGFYLAWHLWRFRQILARVAQILFEVERSTDRVLHSAPREILSGQLGTRQLGYRYQLLEFYLQRVRTILVSIDRGRRIWQRRGSRRISPMRQSRQNLAPRRSMRRS